MEKNLNKNAIYSIIKSCSSILFPLLTFPYISRVLLAQNIGKINFSSSIVSYFSLVASLGITTYAVRECSKVRENKCDLEKVSSELFSINIITTILAYFLLFVILSFSSNLQDYKIIICLQSLSIAFCTLGADWMNTVMEDFRFVTLRTFLFQVISIILMYIFVKNSEDYMKYVFITLIASSGGNIMNVFYRRRYCNTKFIFKMNIKKHLPGIIMLFAMILAQQVFVNSDVTIIGFIEGDKQVGLYTTSVKIYSIVSTFMSSIAWVVMPRLSAAFKHRDYKKVNETLTYVVGFTITLGIPIVVGMFLLAPEIIEFIAGNSYLEAVPSLRMLSIALLFSLGWGIVMNMILLPKGKDFLCLFSCSICAIVNLILNIIFIPVYGIIAAATTTAISQIIGLVICTKGLDEEMNINLDIKDLFGVFIGCMFIISIIIVTKYVLNNSLLILFVSFFLSAFFYFIIQIIFKNNWIKSVLSKKRGDIN